ncbi:MAG: VIT1/CCC1 transporter family protein [Simkania sp.]|nr:VIT1/CCC1 transporter family protein [Simkania sp.]
MPQTPSSDHFQGKSVIEHLKEARTKGALVSKEVHGTEMSGHLAAGADAAKETAVALSLMGILLFLSAIPPVAITQCLWLFLLGWILWKISRSALLAWSRLERLHRLIEEERHEIEHNRDQEKEELKELYEVKGFKGKLLDQAVDVLMADDNRLLQVMLEEELGLSLESYEHPLKQALGAAVGVLITACFSLIGFYLFGLVGLLTGACISLLGATLLISKIERNHLLNTLMWTLATASLSVSIVYFAFALFV